MQAWHRLECRDANRFVLWRIVRLLETPGWALTVFPPRGPVRRSKHDTLIDALNSAEEKTDERTIIHEL